MVKDFRLFYPKGSIALFYFIGDHFSHFNEILSKVKSKEKVSTPNDMLILNDDLNQLNYFDFDRFIHLHQIIPLQINQWTIIIQYAKIINQTYSDTNSTIIQSTMD